MSNIKEMIANRKGQSLIEHNAAVAHMALTLAKEDKLAEDLEYKDKLHQSIYVGALFHDVGKVCQDFQNYLKDIMKDPVVDEADDSDSVTMPDANRQYLDNHRRHNEISYAAMSTVFNAPGQKGVKRSLVDRALYGIYYHHAIPSQSYWGDRKIIKESELTEVYPDILNIAATLADTYMSKEYTTKNFDIILNDCFTSFNTEDEIKDLLDAYGPNRTATLAQELTPPALYKYTTELVESKSHGIPDIKKKSPNPVYTYNSKASLDDIMFNAYNSVVRIYISKADQFISSFSAEEVSQYLDNTRNSKIYAEMIQNFTHKPRLKSAVAKNAIVKPKEYDTVRFKEQCEIVDRIITMPGSCHSAEDIVINAPAGFGKTSIMLMAFARSQAKQLIVLTPRKNIVESDYFNLKGECKNLGLKYTIGMYHGTDKKMCSIHQEDMEVGCNEGTVLKADIVVTTIDTILNTFIAKRNIDLVHSALTSMVAFDEYHEFYTTEALFASYVMFSRVRQLYVRDAVHNKTLYLSASPLPIFKMSNTKGSGTYYIPGEHQHASCQHSKPYKFSMVDYTPETAIPANAVLMVNSVRNTQRLYLKGKRAEGNVFDFICHSKYITEDKSTILSKIREAYGKERKGKEKSERVIACKILQASEDISFKSLHMIHSSPEATLQSIGRCNRWGEYSQGEVTYMFVPYCDTDHKELKEFRSSDRHAIGKAYGSKLCSLWGKHIEDSLGGKSSITLTELYAVYNEFHQANADSILGIIEDTYAESLKTLSDARFEFAGAYEKTKNSELEPTAKRGVIKKWLNLREIGGVFYIVKYYKQDKWISEPMSEGGIAVINLLKDAGKDNFFSAEKLQEVADQLEAGGVYEDLVAYIRSLKSKRRKGKSDEPSDIKMQLKKMANNSRTPYPIFDRVYSEEVGLINSDLI